MTKTFRPTIFFRSSTLLLVGSLALMACGGSPEVVVDGNGDDGDDGDDGNTSTGGRPIIDVGTGGGGGEEPDPDPEPTFTCGDGDLEPGELCDDGNEEDGDGCSGDCQEQDPDFDCSEPGEACVDQVVCGNGRLEGDEACDDGNDEDEDGCPSDCSEVDEGFVCARPDEACVPLPVCGNGVRERGEGCDDDNVESLDGCTGTEDPEIAGCQIEDGFFCTAPGEPCVEAECGNGTRTPDEDCDDGDLSDGDGCSQACEVENGFRCTASGCTPVCGDGIVVAGLEACDDHDRVSGDGCSAACTVEPFFGCTGAPSNCVSSITCGNGNVDPGEVCDPPGTDGCQVGCTTFAPDTGIGAVCGNGFIESGETCDAPNVGNGCATNCQTESGWSCVRPNVCVRLPVCGDGTVQPGEECDVGGSSSPACVGCEIQPDYFCYGAGPSVCVASVCGDGERAPDEECDDDNATNDDGCSSCVIDDGWVCPFAGESCIPRCGDGELVGDEECDDGDRDSDDGCNVACLVEPGFVCDEPGSACTEAECGNGDVEEGEGCDDDNSIAGDGCSATCQNEPTVTVGSNPTVTGSCGDGLITGAEANAGRCDDGNEDNGDGCDDDCYVEDGWECPEIVDLPESLELEVTYRDMKKRSTNDGHPDFEWQIQGGAGIVGPVCTTSNNTQCTAADGTACPNGTCGHLDAQGKPDLRVTSGAAITSATTFGYWYRSPTTGDGSGEFDPPGSNNTVDVYTLTSSITLDQIGGETSDVYRFDDSTFFPLHNLAFGNDGNSTNFHFTSEIRYFFQYQGGESLTFRGDDDVWVFVNGRLAVDIGGVHGASWGRVVLGDDGDGPAADANCSVHGGGEPSGCTLEADEIATPDDKRFGLQVGGLYEIVLFHAERHTSESNFRLTLAGFLAPRSNCRPDCGDGELAGYEVCDDGEENNSDTEYGACNTTCTGSTFCGDGEVQSPEEACDNGVNVDIYGASGEGTCAPGCVNTGSCGDNVVQAGFEVCDNGGSNSDTSYGPNSCKTNCTVGGYCGDGAVNGTETCDPNAPGTPAYGPGSCSFDCGPGPRCGDGVRNGSEQCDGTAHCNSNCTIDAYCGDGVAQPGEECDYAQFASNDYGGCTAACERGPSCGDGTHQSQYEECDEGEAENDGSYDGCTESCTFGPRCGDGVVSDDPAEACDNGYNDDLYTFDDDSCATACSLPPSCGDGVVQSAFELCDLGVENDDGAYEGCTTSCEWGPFCGDGEENGDEECDEGLDNVAYGAESGACGYDCRLAPFCGDGVRNGPEKCDEGDDNTGEYGGCTDSCTLAPRCGDKVVQADEGEQCDDGPTGSVACSVSCKRRQLVPR